MALNIRGVKTSALLYGKTTREAVTCTLASTDYAAQTAPPVWAQYLTVYCASACIVAMGAATSSTNGIDVAGGLPTTFPVSAHSATAVQNLPHCQSASAGAIVYFTWTKDAP